MTVRVNQKEFQISAIAGQPQEPSARMNAFTGNDARFQAGEWVYELELDGTMKDGIYMAGIVTEQIVPASFFWN